jgi:hypothetical protein
MSGRWNSQFNGEEARMAGQDLIQRNFISRSSLPVAAQRWLDRSLPEQFDPPSTVLLEQEGTMDIRGKWIPFKARGSYKAPPLSFRWKARFRLMPGVWVVAEDGHVEGQGWGGSRLWGIIPMGKLTGSEVLEIQTIRNLGDLAWLPSLALADSRLKWGDAGDAAFEIGSKAGDREVVVRFNVSEQGDIVQAYSPSRPYDIPGGFAEAPWHYDFSDHREFSGVRIPTTATATYDKDDGPWEYFRGRITSITFATSSA